MLYSDFSWIEKTGYMRWKIVQVAHTPLERLRKERGQQMVMMIGEEADSLYLLVVLARNFALLIHNRYCLKENC